MFDSILLLHCLNPDYDVMLVDVDMSIYFIIKFDTIYGVKLPLMISDKFVNTVLYTNIFVKILTNRNLPK